MCTLQKWKYETKINIQELEVIPLPKKEKEKLSTD